MAGHIMMDIYVDEKIWTVILITTCLILDGLDDR